MRGESKLDLLLLQPRVHELNRQKFAERVDHFDLVNRERLLNLEPADRKRAKQRLTAGNWLHKPHGTGKLFCQRVIRCEGMLRAKENVLARNRRLQYCAAAKR